MGVPWGSFRQSGGRASTFHEIWQVEWKPEFAVAIIEANVWGNTVEAAATARVVHDADEAAVLPAVTELLDASILAGLDRAVEPLLSRVQAQSAVAADVRHLMDAALPLARVARYGDVPRHAGGPGRADSRRHVRAGLGRTAGGVLLARRRSRGPDGRESRRVQQALDILDLADLQREWQARLRTLMESDVHGQLRGWCCRLLLEKGRLDEDELYRAARLALSPANPPVQCAAWAAGLLKGSGLLLLHQDGVWRVFDRWLGGLSGETFVELLPLVRRAFADFSPAERRQMGEKVKHLGESSGGRAAAASGPRRRQPRSGPARPARLGPYPWSAL